MKRLLSVTAFLISSLEATTATTTAAAAANVASEVNAMINDTIVHLAGGDSSKVAATADGFMHIFTALSTAASLSIFFFKYLIGFIINITMYMLSPLLWLSSTCWHQFVTKPLDLFLHVLHVLYPVIMFCVAAICCGVFIGGCAGFAAEAFSSILISATWGPQATKQIEHEEEDVELIEGLDAKEDEGSDDEEQEKDTYSHDKPSNFFGSTSTATPRNRKGKEPLIPRVESWRDSLSTSSTSSSPVVIRRMKLSSTDRKSSWEWDENSDEGEEEEVEFKHK
ncbi:hypothetical protein FB192DRAFT_1383098 [Mucor lusitanicus]|uniref:Transmembrane protein n=2 Tax=Mucor circinelloides f. lusitanicus TaxID=29924 RepID=A0A162QK38_MUCCL|nr:hypothetical protein FB192DRAFT_1383098 [Mucor lusitanicus]OAD00159.1 hypothetical protein MUCCIDRAFT_113616 [Mucor lusitanicus CBS 277.49]